MKSNQDQNIARDAVMERKMFKVAKKTARPSDSVHTELSVNEKFAVQFFIFGEVSITKSLGMSGCALFLPSLHHLF